MRLAAAALVRVILTKGDAPQRAGPTPSRRYRRSAPAAMERRAGAAKPAWPFRIRTEKRVERGSAMGSTGPKP